MKTGTKEWAASNVNIHRWGCEHDCRYCYGRYNAVRRFKHCTAQQWLRPVIDWRRVRKSYRKREGIVMFPSSHDITLSNLSACLTVLGKLLSAGNKVLIVSKPHLVCIKAICDELSRFKKQITFRFTIGSDNDAVLKFWEPNAPGFAERLECLKHAFYEGFATSVSAEPFLDDNVERLYLALRAHVTDTFWIGKLRDFDRRVDLADITESKMLYVHILKHCQSDEAVRQLHERLNGRPKIMWKDSIREIAK